MSDERGPWSAAPFPNNIVTYWKLDKTEDKWRRRLKLKRNYKFDERLCQPSSTKSSNENVVPSVDPSVSTKIPEKLKHLLLKGVRGITGDINSESYEDNNDTSDSPQTIPPEHHPVSDTVDSADSSDYHAIVQNRKESSSTSGDNDYIEVNRSSMYLQNGCIYLLFFPHSVSLYHFPNSQVLSSVHCVLVTPKRKLAGQLTITRNALHFSFEFLVEGTGGSSVFNRFQDKNDSDSKNETGGLEKPKSNLDGGRGNAAESSDTQIKSQSNKIKHHRRWKITRVCLFSLSFCANLCCLYGLVTYFTHYSSLTDKSSSLDTLPTTIYCY